MLDGVLDWAGGNGVAIGAIANRGQVFSHETTAALGQGLAGNGAFLVARSCTASAVSGHDHIALRDQESGLKTTRSAAGIMRCQLGHAAVQQLARGFVRFAGEGAFDFPLLDGLLAFRIGDAAPGTPGVFVVEQDVPPQVIQAGLGICRARQHALPASGAFRR